MLYVLDWCVVCTGLVCCMYWTGVLYVLDWCVEYIYWTGVLYVLNWCVVCTGLMYCMYWTGDVMHVSDGIILSEVESTDIENVMELYTSNGTDLVSNTIMGAAKTV